MTAGRQPSTLVRGRFVEYRPGSYVQAGTVADITAQGGGQARVTLLSGGTLVTAYSVEELLPALNLSLNEPTLNADVRPGS